MRWVLRGSAGRSRSLLAVARRGASTEEDREGERFSAAEVVPSPVLSPFSSARTVGEGEVLLARIVDAREGDLEVRVEAEGGGGRGELEEEEVGRGGREEVEEAGVEPVSLAVEVEPLAESMEEPAGEGERDRTSSTGSRVNGGRGRRVEDRYSGWEGSKERKRTRVLRLGRVFRRSSTVRPCEYMSCVWRQS
jgi:hypothetical protein